MIREYYEWIGKSLEDKLSTWKQEETENLNGHITIQEVEFIISNLPMKKTPCSNVFTPYSNEFHQTFK